MDLVFFENVVLKYMFTRENLRDRLLPYFKPGLFDDFNNIKVAQTICAFEEKYQRFPTIAEMKLEVESEDVLNKFNEIVNLDTSEFSDEYLTHETEDFIRNKLSITAITDCAQLLKEGDFKAAMVSPDNLRTALSFSFDTNVGYNPFADPEMLWELLHNKAKKIPFGIKFLDKYTKGGAPRKTLTFFLAETNLGKTLIMSSLAAWSALNNQKVLYITCEMAKELIGDRMVANVWDYDINELEFIEKNSFLRMFEYHKKRVEDRIRIEEYAPSTISAVDIRNLLKDLEMKTGFIPDVIYLDYIELIRPIHTKRGDNSYGEYKRAAEEVRAIAVETEIAIISAIQTNREGMGNSQLALKHTADSIGLAFTGDIVVAVTQNQELRDAGKFAMMFLKNRAGINKMRGSCDVDYSRMRIFDGDDQVSQAQLAKASSEMEQATSVVEHAISENKSLEEEGMIEWE